MASLMLTLLNLPAAFCAVSEMQTQFRKVTPPPKMDAGDRGDDDLGENAHKLAEACAMGGLIMQGVMCARG